MRLIVNTVKHIRRSGWIGFASTTVMTLAFFVISIFGAFAYFADLYIRFIEQKSNLIVFFDVGMDQNIVFKLKEKWSKYPQIKDIVYLDEVSAFNLYSDYTLRAQPDAHSALNNLEDKKLDSSLEIRINKLDDLSELQRLINLDVEAQLEELKVYDLSTTEKTDLLGLSTATANYTYKYSDSSTETVPPIKLKVDVETLEEIKDILYIIRICGMGILGLLLLVVVIFIFLISEFRLYNQKEEIGVMQLVGGSLAFIRAPYILEGGFYGFTGAFVNVSTFAGLGYWAFEINKNSKPILFLFKNFSVLDWPTFSIQNLAVFGASIIFFGFFIGASSAYLSIRRYIR